MRIRGQKASILAVTLIILGLILSIALGTSLASVLEKKASISSNKSNIAYQRADTGVEKTMQQIKLNEGRKISDIASCTAEGAIINDTINNYKIELKQENGEIIIDCDADVATIKWIKSIGTADQNQRIIEVAVAASDPAYQTSCIAGNAGGNYPACARIKIATGEVELKVASDWTLNTWTTKGDIFSPATLTGLYGVSFTEVSPGQLQPLCCRTDLVNGSVECKFATSASLDTWTDTANPW